MSFKPETFLQDAVSSKDVEAVKGAICGYIDMDAGNTERIKNALNYVEQNGINIWQNHEEIEKIKPKTEWNLDYLALIQADLMYNFSKERMNLILEIGKHIYPRTMNSSNKSKTKSTVKVTPSSSNNKKSETSSKNSSSKNQDLSSALILLALVFGGVLAVIFIIAMIQNNQA